MGGDTGMPGIGTSSGFSSRTHVISRKSGWKVLHRSSERIFQRKPGRRNVAQSIKNTIERIGYVLDESFRILSMQFILVPAAYVLPRNWALITARAVSLLGAVLLKPGFKMYWQMRQVFGKKRLDSFLLSWDWITRIFSDFVVLKRILYKRENPMQWKIVERNAGGIQALRESGESYIIASAHFPKASTLSQHSPMVTYGHPLQVGDALKKRVRSLKDLRIRIQYGALVKVISSSIWGREVEHIHSRTDLRAARILHRRLRERGNVVFIPVDAPWSENVTGAFERPFAGHKKKVLSSGAAQLARLSKCAIISCVSMLENDGTIVLQWGDPIRIDDNKSTNEVDVMNELMDALEIAIGERPTQYTFEIGWGRRWNSKSKRWEDIIY